jgi:ABC-type bacteriocin/lantibiotic exporter with double-glycine peptidase domain
MRRCWWTRIIVLTILCSCAATAEASGYWLDVPFVRQTSEGCGSAVIAMVMQYWSQRQGLEPLPAMQAANIQQDLYSKAAHGIYSADLERYFREQGFRTFAFRGAWADFEHHIEKGRPLIVALKPAGNDSRLHFVVVVGFDAGTQQVLINDPAERKLLKRDRGNFEKEWNSVENWTLLALPEPSSH